MRSSIINKIIGIVLCTLIIVVLFPIASGKKIDVKAEEDNPFENAKTLDEIQEIVENSEYKNILSPEDPKSFNPNPGKDNPFNIDNNQKTVINNKDELINFTHINKVDSKNVVTEQNAKFNIGKEYKPFNERGEGDSAPKKQTDNNPNYITDNKFAGNQVFNSGSFKETDFFYKSGYQILDELSYIQSVSWDPTGCGRNTNLAFIGISYLPGGEELGFPPSIRVIDISTTTTSDSESKTPDTSYLDIGDVAKWVQDDPLTDYEALNFLSITAGDYNGDGKDELVVYAPTATNDYGLFEITYVEGNLKTISKKNKTMLHPDYRSLGLDSSTKKQDKLGVDLATGDFNKDGIDDIAAISYVHMVSDKYVHSGVDLFKPYLAISYGGKSDNAVVEKKECGTYIQGEEGFDENDNPIIPSMYGTSLAIGDFYGDGYDEIIVAGYERVITADRDHPTIAKNNGEFGAYFGLASYLATNGSITKGAYQTMPYNAWTRGGLYVGPGGFMDDLVSQPMSAECVDINGPTLDPLIFVNGSLYEVVNHDLVCVFTPNYFDHADAAGPKGYVSNTFIRSVAVGNFDGNEEGRQQVAFTFGLKSLGESFNYYKYGIIGGTDYSVVDKEYRSKDEVEYKATSFYSNDLDGNDNYVWEDRQYDNPYASLNCIVATADIDVNDGMYLRFSNKVENLYSNPTVTAVLQAAPYFEELDQPSGLTFYTLTTEYDIGRSNNDRFSFSGGGQINIANDFHIHSIQLGGHGGWTDIYSKSYTTSYSQIYKAGSADSVVVTRIPNSLFRYDLFSYTLPDGYKGNYEKIIDDPLQMNGYWLEDAISIDVPKEPYSQLLSISEYNRFCKFYNCYLNALKKQADNKDVAFSKDLTPLKAIDEETISSYYLMNEGKPWNYNSQTWETSTSDMVNTGYGDIYVQEGKAALGYNGGSITTESDYSKTQTTGKDHSKGVNFNLSLTFQIKSIANAFHFGGYAGFEWDRTTGWTVSNTSKTTISGTVVDLDIRNRKKLAPNDLVIENYKYVWGFGQKALKDKDNKPLSLDQTGHTSYTIETEDATDHFTKKKVKKLKNMKETSATYSTPLLTYVVTSCSVPAAAPFDLDVENTKNKINLSWSYDVDPQRKIDGHSDYVLTIDRFNIYELDYELNPTLIGYVTKDGQLHKGDEEFIDNNPLETDPDFVFDNTQGGTSLSITSAKNYTHDISELFKNQGVHTLAVTATYHILPAGSESGEQRLKETIYSNKISCHNFPISEDGAPGKSAYEIAVEQGYKGSVEEWLQSLVGRDGKSAYEIAKDSGYTGSESEWLMSLIGKDGKDGADGLSAYEVAKKNGYTGSESEWLQSLKGNPGLSAYEVYVKNVTENSGDNISQDEWEDTIIPIINNASNANDLITNSHAAYVKLLPQSYSNTMDKVSWLKEIALNASYSLYSKYGADNSKSIEEFEQELKDLDPSIDTYVNYINSLLTDDNKCDDITYAKYIVTYGSYKVFEDKVNKTPMSEEEWLASLKGETGAKGDKGDTGATGAQGDKGDKGEKGDTGETGADGKSAYDLAVYKGYKGTLEQWLDSLKGEAGAKGDKGDKGDTGATGAQGDKGDKGEKGDTGETGDDGKSAYDLAVDKGYEGTLEQWLASLKGEAGAKGDKGDAGATGAKGDKGDKGDTGAQGEKGETGAKGDKGEKGDTGDTGETGAAGKSAYDLAKEKGYEGSEQDWLESLVGKAGVDGTNGKSAYEIACDNGFVGTVDEWLDSLVGAKGDTGVAGRGIASIDTTPITDGTRLGTRYTINYTDGIDPFVFEVYNGADGQKGDKGDKGDQGEAGKDGRSFIIKAMYETLDELIKAHPTGEAGDTYVIGTVDDSYVYVWDADDSRWENIGRIQGEPGKDGKDGKDGKNGADGITPEVTPSKGLNGKDGKDGKNGIDGKDGKSAYDIAVENGFEGSESDWINSLQGQEFYADDDMNLKLKLANGSEVVVGKIVNDNGEIALSAVDQTARTTSKAAVGIAGVGLVYNLASLIYLLIKRKKHF